MEQFARKHPPIARVLDVLTLLASVVLLVAISWEILTGNNLHFSDDYLAIQFVICLLYLADFVIRAYLAACPLYFMIRNLPFLLLSIPYLNLLMWSGVEMARSWAMLVGIIPLLRAFLALFIVVRWLVANHAKRILVAYILTVTTFTYISALIFYDYEVLVNTTLHGFGNALWWACMNVTTVGAAIYPVTGVGKVICVMLPVLGMMMFPIFTVYVVQQYTKRK